MQNVHIPNDTGDASQRSPQPRISYIHFFLLLCIGGGILACGPDSTVVNKMTPAPTASSGGGHGGNFPVPCGLGCVSGGGQVPTVVISDWRFPASGNPLLATTPFARNLLSTIWSACLAQAPDGTYHPDQCTAIPSVANGDESAAGRTTMLHFRPDLKWAKGQQPITANDFAFAAMLAHDRQITAQPLFADVQAINVIDAQTLIIIWQHPFAAYLDALTQLVPLPLFAFPGVYNPADGMYNASAAQVLLGMQNFSTQLPANNGALILNGGHAGQAISLIPNPNYRSSYFHAFSSGIDFATFTKAASKADLIAQFKAKNVDLAQGLDESDLTSFGGIDAQQQVVTPRNAFELLAFNERPAAPNAAHNNGTSIFGGAQGQSVRTAIIKAFDRCAALQAALQKGCDASGFVTDENTTPLASDYDGSVPLPGLDISGAQSLLDQAGLKVNGGKRTYPDGTAVTLKLVTLADDPARAALLSQLKQNLESALHITCELVTSDTLYAPYDQGGVLANGAYDIALVERENGTDPASEFTFVQSDQIPSATYPAGQNFLGVQDSTLDAQIAAAASEIDPTKRVQGYQALQRTLTADVYTEPLYVHQRVVLVSPRLLHYQPSPVVPGEVWDFQDWAFSKQ